MQFTVRNIGYYVGSFLTYCSLGAKLISANDLTQELQQLRLRSSLSYNIIIVRLR